MMPLNNPTNHGWKEEEGKLLPPGCEVHLQEYLLSLQVHEGKIEMHTSLQVYMCEAVGQEQYAILNYM